MCRDFSVWRTVVNGYVCMHPRRDFCVSMHFYLALGTASTMSGWGYLSPPPTLLFWKIMFFQQSTNTLRSSSFFFPFWVALPICFWFVSHFCTRAISFFCGRFFFASVFLEHHFVFAYCVFLHPHRLSLLFWGQVFVQETSDVSLFLLLSFHFQSVASPKVLFNLQNPSFDAVGMCNGKGWLLFALEWPTKICS